MTDRDRKDKKKLTDKAFHTSKNGWISRRLWKIALHSRKNVYVSDVDRDYLATLMVEKCPVFGYDLIYGGTGKTRPHNLAALDRIDNDIGYMKGNIHVISDLANSMKRDASRMELLAFAKWALGRFDNEKAEKN